MNILRLGTAAHSCILQGGRGKVLASFSQAIYLLTGSGELFWITTEDAPMHRRCVQISAPLPGLPTALPFHMQDHHLAFDYSVILDMEKAPVWSAPYLDPTIVIDLTGLFSRIQFLFSHLDHSQAGGFGVFIPHILSLSRGMDADALPEPADPILHFARPLILNMARACLQGRSTLIAQSAGRLIRLGSGLTPSGDDFLGGLSFSMASLQVAYPDLFQTTAILPIETYRSQTHLISFTLLKDLAGGHAVAPLHSLMLGILGGGALDDILPAINGLTGIGHSTGWDLLTGMLAGFLITAPGIHLVPSVKKHYLEV
jgi:hypothetical protein